MIMICSSLFVPLTSGPIKFLQTFYPVLITCLYHKDIKIQNLDILEIPFRMNFKMCSSHYTAWKIEVISELDELCNVFPKSQFAVWNRGSQRCCDSALLSTAATSCRVLRGFRDAISETCISSRARRADVGLGMRWDENRIGRCFGLIYHVTW